ncbi:MAG: 7,8-didemethyl-8-hydroxy-5-deazariboflavin synthase subunit CofG [Promethearchaeota archaeon]
MNRQLSQKLERISQSNEKIDVIELTNLLSLTNRSSITQIMQFASEIRDQHFHDQISYSRNVFIPLTRWCRNACGYCGFRKTEEPVFMAESEIDALLKLGKKSNCGEVLITMGEKPEFCYEKVKIELKKRGYATSTELVKNICARALDYRLLPHINPGVVDEQEMQVLRPFIASLGLMLESMDFQLGQKGSVHELSPTKNPNIRLRMIRKAGMLRIPFTTGLLIGIGESIQSRAHSILEIRKLIQEFGHIQEVIIQNFVPNSTMTAKHLKAPSKREYLLVIALMRILCPTMNIQAPPNLNKGNEKALIEAGINDWGGISPITIDHINPSSLWPIESELRKITEEAGFRMIFRLPVYEKFISSQWLAEKPMSIAFSSQQGDSDSFSS